MPVAIVLLLGVIAGVFSQESYYPLPHQAAILSDARYLAGDGTFGAAYSQDDGLEFKEESDVEGNRRGSYSYIDPTGQRRTVTYTAGKNGFQATGDHIPSAPPQVPPQPEYVPLAQYNPPDYQPPNYAPPTPRQYPRRYQPDYEPQPVAYQPQPQPQYQPQNRPQYQLQNQPQYQPQYQPVPEPPQYQPVPTSPQYRYRPQPSPRYHYPPELQSIPSYAPPRPRSQPELRPASRHNAISTPATPKFYPPGKLSFNRTPDGFSYTFSKS